LPFAAQKTQPVSVQAVNKMIFMVRRFGAAGFVLAASGE